jgi:S-adenosylmethionine:tRNA ribosyltransferase-isomerase
MRRSWWPAGPQQLQYHAPVHRRDFAYELPTELIAQKPLPERSASRMLVLARTAAAAASSEGVARADRAVLLEDRMVRDLPQFLRRGDLLIFNDTKVVAARLLGTKRPSGGRVEILLERAVGRGREALVQVRASKPIRDGLEIATSGGAVRVLGREGDLWRIEVPGPVLEFFEKWGQVPLPPYIHRPAETADRERYQSIFARQPGAVAAPTASLHFDSELESQLERHGVGRAFVTLHVGAGTFQPIRVDDLESHTMHAERVTVSAATCEAIERTHADGKRVVAIGTTVVRALESAALVSVSAGGPLRSWTGETRLFIRPGFRFRIVDALLTNFHLPESTLLMLVCAFAGTGSVLRAYQHAVQARYRFFSYGDAMLLLP